MNIQSCVYAIVKWCSIVLVGIFSLVVMLHQQHVSALAGFAEQVYRYEYSSGLTLNIGAPSDMCPSEYGNQRCMWVEPASYSSTSSIPYYSSPTFLSISDIANGYVAGQAYEDKQWILYNTKNDKTEFTFNSESGLKSKISELGGSGNLYDLSEVKDHFKKIKEPFDYFSLIFILIPFIVLIGIPGGIIFIIYKIIRKVLYPVKNSTPTTEDVPLNTVAQTSVPAQPEVQAIATTTPPVVVQNNPSNTSVTLSAPLPDKNQEYKTIASVIFILVVFAYLGNYLMSSTNEFSLASLLPKEKALGGKALLRKITNKEVIKDSKSLTELHEKEGLLKDNLAVYRCNFIVDTFSNCVVQDVVKHPESFSRVTNIFGKDNEFVYVVDEKTNNYKVLKEASAPTFRPLYNGMTDSFMGLYAGDDYHLFKGEKILTIKSVPTGMTDAIFYKQYRTGEADVPGRHPYSRMAKGFDGEIQYMADDQFMYHGDGKASSTDPFIHLTKVEGADLKTFTYYQQKMLGTAYFRYATDKNNVYCDNVTLDGGRYFVSNGLTVIKDLNPKSFQVIYPTSAITEQNADLQVAKTDSQVFVNCKSYTVASTSLFSSLGYLQNYYTDKHALYYIDTVLSTSDKATSTYQKIPDLNLYLRYTKGSSTPSLAFSYEAKREPLSKVDIYDYFREIGVISKKTDTVPRIFSKPTFTVATSGDSVRINDGRLSFVVPKVSPHKEITPLEKSISNQGILYLIKVSFSNNAERGMCAACSEDRIHIYVVKNNSLQPVGDYPYYSGWEGNADGDVLVYKKNTILVLSNYISIMYFDYKHPEWGILRRNFPVKDLYASTNDAYTTSTFIPILKKIPDVVITNTTSIVPCRSENRYKECDFMVSSGKANDIDKVIYKGKIVGTP